MATLRVIASVTAPLTTLTALANATADPGVGTVRLSWDTPPVTQGVSSIEARWAGTWTPLSISASGPRQFADLALDPGPYTIDLAPVAAGVRGPIVSLSTTVLAPPTAPDLAVVAEQIGPTTIRIKWTGAEGNVTIDLKAGDRAFERIYTGPGGVLPTGERFADIQEVRAGVTYTIRVEEV